MAVRATRKKRTDLRQVAFTRFMLIVAFFVLWIAGIGTRLVYLQVNQHEELRKKALVQRRDVKQTKQLRGTIYDRNERALAISINVKTLYADATKIEDVEETAKTLSGLLKLNAKELTSQLEEARSLERRFVPIAKGLDEQAVQNLNRDLERRGVKKADLPKFPGLHWRDEQKRSYPHRSLAAHVVGFSNHAGVGQAGIEQSQNDILYGAVIKRTQERDRLGRVYDELVSEKEPPRDIVLTIDNTVQYIAEQSLEKAVRASNAKAGMAIVISNKTGEVLAMANYPTFDPNDLEGITAENLANGSIQNMYSPGSVFKLITYGSALEKDLISPEAEIDTGGGTIEVAKHKFKDHGSLGRISYAKAMAVSSNVAAIKTSLRVGREDFYSTVKKFGFGNATGIELPAETPGLVRPIERWFGDSLASMSIGYEIGVSALQMANAFATIANDGVRIQPHLIKEIRQSDETIVSVTRPEKTQVVSVETARDLRKMLRQVVLNGTGKRAQVAGYTIAGKTGTAWKFDEKLKRVNSAKYVSSFIGFAPADNPDVTIAVVIDEPRSGGRDGGSVAAPAFREIAERILPELNVRRDEIAETLADSGDEVVEPVGNGEVETNRIGDDSAVGSDELQAIRPSLPIVGRKPAASRSDTDASRLSKKVIDRKTTGTPNIKGDKQNSRIGKHIETESRN